MKFSIITVLAIVVSVASFPVPSAPAPRAAGKKDSIGQKLKSCKKRPSKRSGTQLYRRNFGDGNDCIDWTVMEKIEAMLPNNNDDSPAQAITKAFKTLPFDEKVKFREDIIALHNAKVELIRKFWNRIEEIKVMEGLNPAADKEEEDGGTSARPARNHFPLPQPVKDVETDGAARTSARPDGKQLARQRLEAKEITRALRILPEEEKKWFLRAMHEAGIGPNAKKILKRLKEKFWQRIDGIRDKSRK
jgi:hypothetical protein